VKKHVDRRAVDLSAYPDLVVIYLGMRVNEPRGIKRLLSLGPQIQRAADAKPDGLLHHQFLMWSVIPVHVGMRQYWRDFDSLETWARSLQHLRWWQQFVRDTGGTGFWHELYFMRGGMEAIYDDMPQRLGLAAFAPTHPARGPLFSARDRLRLGGEARVAPPVPEHALYGRDD
jgi:hypothetical protein